jgi:hypothetical protein
MLVNRTAARALAHNAEIGRIMYGDHNASLMPQFKQRAHAVFARGAVSAPTFRTCAYVVRT